MTNELAAGIFIGMLLERTRQQETVIDLQARLLKQQQRIDSMIAGEPSNEEAWFHVATGKLPDDVLNGDNLESIDAYIRHLHQFVNKHVAPYIHPKTKNALYSYLMRGIAEQQTRIQMRQKFGAAPPPPLRIERPPAQSGAKAQ